MCIAVYAQIIDWQFNHALTREAHVFLFNNASQLPLSWYFGHLS